jgi:transcription elongation factor GreA
MDKVPMTVAGAASLRQELDRLKSKERPRIIKEIATAREQGDLRENAEYQYAKEEQGLIEGRIADIEGKLSRVQIIDITTIESFGKVIFGATVGLVNLEDDSEVTYKIVGDDEADLKESKISVYTPIARALIGKDVGDVVVVKTPSGDVQYEIDSVEHL